MPLFEQKWQEWMDGRGVDLSDLSIDEQIRFHKEAVRVLKRRSPRFATVPLSLIVKPDRPIDRTTIDALKERIMSGPPTLIVVQKNDDGTFRLIDGLHKLLALEELGNTEGPVEIR